MTVESEIISLTWLVFLVKLQMNALFGEAKKTKE